MTKARYAEIVNNKFPGWLHKAFGKKKGAFLVQDHERALWGEEPRAAMRAAIHT